MKTKERLFEEFFIDMSIFEKELDKPETLECLEDHYIPKRENEDIKKSESFWTASFGNNNVAIGYRAGISMSGAHNTMIGRIWE